MSRNRKSQIHEHTPEDFSCEENVEMILENNGMSLNHDFGGVDVNPAELFSVASPLSSDHVRTPKVYRNLLSPVDHVLDQA